MLLCSQQPQFRVRPQFCHRVPKPVDFDLTLDKRSFGRFSEKEAEAHEKNPQFQAPTERPETPGAEAKVKAVPKKMPKGKKMKECPVQKVTMNITKYLDQEIIKCRFQREKYKIKEFKQLKILLVNIYFEKELTEDFFASMSPHNLALLNTVIPKIFKINRPRMKLTREVLNSIHSKPNNLKPEQKLKLVYRQVFRNLYKDFMKHYSKFNAEQLGIDSSAVTDCPKKSFYFWLFQESVRRGHVSLDVVMDVVCNNSWQNKRPSRGDWRRIKMEALKQMSAPLRYLISKDSRCKAKILGHFDDTSRKGFPFLASLKIQNQLIKKFNTWKQMLQESNNNFKLFRKKLRIEAKNSNTLYPWTLGMVKRAVQFCKEDLEDRDLELKRKFEKMMEVTYPAARVQATE